MSGDLLSHGCELIRGETICSNNITLIFFDGVARNISNCTLETCSLLISDWDYLPNLGGNLFFVIVFAAFCLAQIGLGLWKRTWGVLIGMTIGTLFEVLGYIGRVQAHNNPFTFNAFLIYIVFLTIAPAFLSAAIYLCLARIIVVFGKENARFRPRTYSIVFMVSDFVSLLLQGAGGGIASTSDGDTTAQMGINIMIAGLVWQVVSLTFFAVAALDFGWSVKHRGFTEPAFSYLRDSRKFKAFLWALTVATLAVYVRSLYRVAELSQGFDGHIASEEVPFMFFEPLMITIACICLTVWHPSIVFGNVWHVISKAGSKKGSSGTELGTVRVKDSTTSSSGVRDPAFDDRVPYQGVKQGTTRHIVV